MQVRQRHADDGERQQDHECKMGGADHQSKRNPQNNAQRRRAGIGKRSVGLNNET
jgi:hypothetical protein